MFNRKRLTSLARRWETSPRDEVDTKLAALARQLLAFTPTRKHDVPMMAAIEEAFRAADRGNPGVGAILVAADGTTVLHRSGPSNLRPHFRSDLHAEMHLLNTFENRRKFPNQAAVQAAMTGCTLYSSLEPCTMCTARLVMSGVTNCYHAADDDMGGSVNSQDTLPTVWKQLIAAGNKDFARADCSDELRSLGFQTFLITIQASGRSDLWPENAKKK